MNSDSWTLKISTDLCRALLYLYPAEFRREFGREMVLIVRDTSRMEVERGGPAAITVLWVTLAWDLIATAFVERLREVTNMTTSSFARLSGLGGVLAGLIYLLLILLAFSRDQVDPVENYVVALAAAWMIVVAAAIYVEGRFDNQGKLALGLLAIGLVFTIAASILYAIEYDFEDAAAFGSQFVGLCVQGISIAILGAALRSANESSSWGRMLIVIGLLLLLIWPITFLALALLTGDMMRLPQSWSDIIYASALLVQAIAWILLGGLAYWGGARSPEVPAQPAA